MDVIGAQTRVRAGEARARRICMTHSVERRVYTWSVHRGYTRGVGGADSKIGSRQGDFGFGWQVQLVRMFCYRSMKSSSGCVCAYVPKMSKKLRTVKYFPVLCKEI